MISRIQKQLREQAESTRTTHLPISQTEILSSLNGWREQAEELIASRPAACLLSAVAVGFLFGWWIKHK